MNRNLVGSTYGRFCIKFPQSRMKGERHRLSPLSLQLFVYFCQGRLNIIIGPQTKQCNQAHTCATTRGNKTVMSINLNIYEQLNIKKKAWCIQHTQISMRPLCSWGPRVSAQHIHALRRLWGQCGSIFVVFCVVFRLSSICVVFSQQIYIK